MKSINNLENKASSKKRTSFIKIFTFLCFSFLSLTLIFSGFSFNSKESEYTKAHVLVYNTSSYVNISDKLNFDTSTVGYYKASFLSAQISSFLTTYNSKYYYLPYQVALSFDFGGTTYSKSFYFSNSDYASSSNFPFLVRFRSYYGTYTLWIYRNNGTEINLTFNYIRLYYYYGSTSLYSNQEYLDYGESQYQAGQESVDITTDNNQAIQDYITDNNYHTDTEYNQYGESQYQAGQNSVDITTDNNQAIQDYITDNNYHTDTEYNQYGESQYQAGQESVDITTDNNQAIQDYIANNNYHTDTEYNQYGENQYNSGYTTGQNSVDITTDNNQAIQDYITNNNYHTDTEYNQYGESRYQAGQNSVDITTDNQQAIDDFILSTAFECNESYDKFQLSTQVTSYSVTLPENLFELVSVNFTLISYYSSGGFLYNDTFDFSVNSFPYVVIGSKNAEYCKISLSDNVLLFEFITPTNTNGFFCYIDSLNVVYTCMGYTQEQYDLNYDNGYDLGNSEGYSTGFDSGYDTGYSDGYVVGGNDELNGKNTFKDLIYSIIDAPFNVISSAFDFDIFGINIASFLMLIVSLLLVAFVLRRLL